MLGLDCTEPLLKMSWEHACYARPEKVGHVANNMKRVDNFERETMNP
jgi:hypothetical protein